MHSSTILALVASVLATLAAVEAGEIEIIAAATRKETAAVIQKAKADGQFDTIVKGCEELRRKGKTCTELIQDDDYVRLTALSPEVKSYRIFEGVIIAAVAKQLAWSADKMDAQLATGNAVMPVILAATCDNSALIAKMTQLTDEAMLKLATAAGKKTLADYAKELVPFCKADAADWAAKKKAGRLEKKPDVMEQRERPPRPNELQGEFSFDFNLDDLKDPVLAMKKFREKEAVKEAKVAKWKTFNKAVREHVAKGLGWDAYRLLIHHAIFDPTDYARKKIQCE